MVSILPELRFLIPQTEEEAHKFNEIVDFNQEFHLLLLESIAPKWIYSSSKKAKKEALRALKKQQIHLTWLEIYEAVVQSYIKKDIVWNAQGNKKAIAEKEMSDLLKTVEAGVLFIEQHEDERDLKAVINAIVYSFHSLEEMTREKE